jgi:adenosylmethionine-8-amino-7-oxononanoate aminotransferase
MAAFAREEAPSIVRGEGCDLFDEEGRRYLDGISSLWCNVHGHRRAEIDEAIRDQLDRIAHSTLLGLRSPPASELARRLVSIAPEGLEWVFYSDSGSSAVEIALKMVFQMWRNRGEERKTFVTLGQAYHGDTIGSVSLGGIDLFHRIFAPLLFQPKHVPAPHCLRCPLGLERGSCELECADLVDRALAEEPAAAVVMEPLVQGAAGMIVHPEGYLRRMREACDRHSTLLVCDEVATGFGRTGRMFACEHEGVRPDLMAVAKGLTGGYLPLAATLTTGEVFDAFLGEHADGKHFFHGHTFTGNALGCAAALASLDLFETDRVLDELPAKIDRLAERLARLEGHPHVLEVRRRGLMVGIELALDPAKRESYDPALRMGHQVVLRARARGVILRPLGDVVVLMPPLAITEDQIDQLVEVTCRSIDEATAS